MVAQDHSRVISAWAAYCARFRLAPESLIGMTYPGLERDPMTVDMAELVRKRGK